MVAGTTWRRGVAIILAAAGLLTGACSGDDTAAEEDSPDERTETTAPEPSITTTTLSDQEFAATMDEFTTAVEAAGDDFCEVVLASSLSLDTAASTPDQVERTVALQTTVMEALASTTPVDEENAERLRRAAERLTEAAEEANHEPGFLAGEEANDILLGDEFQQALDAYFTRAEDECDVPETPGPQDAAPGPDAP